MIDSGVNSNHKTFRSPFLFTDISRVTYQKSFITGDSNTYDSNGHGTHVAGLALGDTYAEDRNIREYRGVASRAKLISLRVLNYNGVGNTADLLRALDRIYQNRNNSTYNMRVVNISLGTPAVESYRNDPLCRAVRKLVDAGIVVVAAAGNNGKDAQGRKIYGMIKLPGNEPSAITVGASNTFQTDVRNDDGVATYSSRGPTRSYWTDSNNVRHYDHIINRIWLRPEIK